MDEISAIPFSFFVSLLYEISKCCPKKTVDYSGYPHNPTYAALQIFHQWACELCKKYVPLPRNTTVIVFRLLFPEEDSRRKYDIQETRLSQLLVDCLGVSGADYDRGHSLRRWAKENTSGCLGQEVQKVMAQASSDIDAISSLSIADVDVLLDELASISAFSDSTLRRSSHRARFDIICSLYRSLSPRDASFLTQIILKDLRPLVYPLSETHYTAALRDFNSTSVKMLNKEDAMNVWDPSGRMLAIYRVRPLLDEAAMGFENKHDAHAAPKLRMPVEMPKSVKGRSCSHAIWLLKYSQKIWAETKYDGERAQIHIEIDGDGSSRITIFSKSKRDSTLDRWVLHPIIRNALGLSNSGNNIQRVRKFMKNLILDAEMVAFTDHDQKIDEFWRIRGLIEGTAHGIRCSRSKVTNIEQARNYLESQSSILSDASDNGTRHLALVFFDCLVLDSTSLLSSPYSLRRSILESLVGPIPGRAMLSHRTAIDLNTIDGMTESEKNLRQVFARVIANHQEGLVLKADEGKYNDILLPWVKLKKDYIPGYGDSLDLVVVAAGWDKGRARELRVAPTAFTTFYVGVLTDKDDSKENLTSKPHFEVYFTVSYGLSRDELEETNFLVKCSDPVEYSKFSLPSDDLAYTFNILPSLPSPAVIMRIPLLVELYGAGFTKAPGSKHYELRFPRMTKIFRPSERPWNEGINLKELHKIAREVIGRDRSDKDVDDWCNNLWGKPVSPGTKCSLKRKAATHTWEEKLAVVDARVTRSKCTADTVPGHSGQTARYRSASFSRPLQPTTNVKQPMSTPCDGTIQLPEKDRIRQKKRESAVVVKPIDLTCFPRRGIILNDGSKYDIEHNSFDPIKKFIQGALVWIARPCEATGSPGHLLLCRQFLPDRHLHSLESLLVGCGWHVQIGGNMKPCDWVERGVIIVDTGERYGSEWKAYVLKTLKDRKAMCTNREKGKPVWVFDSTTLADTLETDIESKAIYRLARD